MISISLLYAFYGNPTISVTRGTFPGAGGTCPPPGLFLPAAGPLLPAAAQTLPAAVRPLPGPRAHGPTARDSVAVSTTHAARLAAPPPRQEVRRWRGMPRASPRVPGVTGERRPGAAPPRRRQAGPSSCRAATP